MVKVLHKKLSSGGMEIKFGNIVFIGVVWPTRAVIPKRIIITPPMAAKSTPAIEPYRCHFDLYLRFGNYEFLYSITQVK